MTDDLFPLTNIYYFIKGVFTNADLTMDKDEIIDCDSFKMHLDHTLMHDKFLWYEYNNRKNLTLYEPEITSIIKKEVERGDTFIDAGANNGYYTLLASGLVGKTGRVSSFEPVANTFNNLERNISINKFTNITTYNMGLGDSEKSVAIYTNKNNAGDSLAKRMGTIAEEIHITTLDKICTYPVDFVKCDIEGSELMFLKGAQKTLKNNPKLKIVMEINQPMLRKLNQNCQEIFDTLTENGFVIKEIVRAKGLSSKEITTYKGLSRNTTDIYCVKG